MNSMWSYLEIIFKKFSSNKVRYLNIIFTIALSISLIIVYEFNIQNIQYAQLDDQIKNVSVDFTFSYDDINAHSSYSQVKQELIENFQDIEIYNTIDFELHRGVINNSLNINWSYYNEDFLGFFPIKMIGVESSSFSNLSNTWDFLQIININESGMQNGVIIDNITANNLNLTLNERICIGNYDLNENQSYSVSNYYIKGIFSLLDYYKFVKVFGFENEGINLKYMPKLIYPIDIAQNLSISLVNRSIGHVNFGINLDHSKIILNSIEENEYYIKTITNYIDSKYSISYFNNYIKKEISNISNYMESLKLISSIIQIPIIVLSFLLIKLNIKHLQIQNLKTNFLLKCRSASSKKIIKMLLIELTFIGIIAGILGIFFGLIIFKISSNWVLSHVGLIAPTLPNNILLENINLLIIPVFIALFEIYIAAYSYLKIIVESENELISSIQSDILEENIFKWKYKRKLQCAILIITIIFILLDIIDVLTLYYGIAISSKFHLFINNINWIYYLGFILIPIVLIFMCSELFFPYLQIKIKNKFSNFFKKSNMQLHFIFKKFHITTNSSQRDKAGIKILIFLILGMSFSSIFNFVIYNQKIAFTQKMDNYLGGDSHLYIPSSYGYNFDENFSTNYINKQIYSSSELDIEFISTSYRQNQIEGVNSLCSDKVRRCYSRFDLVAINSSRYFEIYEINQNDLGGVNSLDIQSKLISEPNSILVPKEFFTNLGLNLGDQIELEYFTYNNGTPIKSIEHFKIIGVFASLPGMIPYVNEESTEIFIIDYNNLVKNLELIPKWDGLSLSIKYDFTQSNLDILEKYDLIKASEIEVKTSLLNSYDLFIENKFDTLYKDYSLKLMPLTSFLTIEQYLIFGISLIGMFSIILSALESKRKEIIKMQIKGINNKIIFKFLLFEFFVNLSVCLIFLPISIILGVFVNNSINEFYFFQTYFSKIHTFSFNIPVFPILLHIFGFTLILFLSYVVSYYLIIKRTKTEKITEILRIS